VREGTTHIKISGVEEQEQEDLEEQLAYKEKYNKRDRTDDGYQDSLLFLIQV